jgi:oligopeptide/dipeptide ABC transporter ATP-binding protein
MLTITDVHVHYPVGRKILRAVDGVSLDVAAGETLGIVGESGCGKSTLAKAVLGLVKPVQGSVTVDSQNPDGLSGTALLGFRRNVQMVFQDPYASLSPRRTILQSLLEPLEVHQIGNDRKERIARAEATLDAVGLDRTSLSRYPHEFSGGQRQRIGIARAIIADPKLVILDEPVSALDISVRAQVINLLADIQRTRNVGYMFIGHDLALMRHVTDRVAVMYLGRVVELGTTAEIFDKPQHPYTRSLILSAPSPDPTKRRTAPALDGDPPSPLDIPSGCRFQTRCAYRTEKCLTDDPQLIQLGDARRIACHHSNTLPAWTSG